MVAGRNDCDAAEPSYVAEHQVLAVVEAPPGPPVGVVDGRRGHVESAGHAQVDDEFAAAALLGQQVDEEVLPAPSYRLHAVSHGLRGLGELRRGMGVAVDDPGSDEERFELCPHGLDLGKLGHGATVPIV